MVNGDEYTSNVRAFKNDGSGNFGEATVLSIGGPIMSTCAADFDGDGDFDVAAADKGRDAVLVVKNTTGEIEPPDLFQDAQAVGASGKAIDMCSGDFDGDGDDELAFTSIYIYGHTEDDNYIEKLEHNDGLHKSTLFYGKAGTFGGPFPIGSGDIDGNGDDDIVAGRWTLRVGDGVHNSWYFAAQPGVPRAADLNNDGYDDLMICNDSLNVLLNDGSGYFPNPIALMTPAAPIEVVAVDIDNDDDFDLAVSCSGNWSIFLNTGDGSFPDRIDYPASPARICAADFNNDSWADLASASSSTMSVFLNNGDGTISIQASYTVGSSAIDICASDFDNDGYIDLAVLNNGSDDITAFINDGAGLFLPGGLYPVSNDPRAIEALDIDKDGDMDLAAVCYVSTEWNGGGGNVNILYNKLYNRPVLSAIGSRNTTENVNLQFTVSATDPDGTIPTLSADNLPAGATFVDSGNGIGLFDWTPTYSDSGLYIVAFTATDGLLSDTELVEITVEDDPTDVNDDYSQPAVPTFYQLSQNYPNPFNPVTRIDYALSERQHAVIVVYNILGQWINTIVDEEKPAGWYSVLWNGKTGKNKSVESGIYFYRLTAGDFSEARKMVLLK
jgi:hypothetical protein